MAKPQRRCIFCGGTGLTREHIWADWLKKFVPRPHTFTRHTLDRQKHDEISGKIIGWSKKGRLNRSGDPRSQKMPVVCMTCNTGWMSKLQELAKPILAPLIIGNWTDLDVISQKTLSAWATMFVMVYEWADEETLASTQDERTYFKSNRTPPNHWMIWMGRYTGKKQIPCKHTGMRVQDMGLPLSSPNADGFLNVIRRLTHSLLGRFFFTHLAPRHLLSLPTLIGLMMLTSASIAFGQFKSFL